MSKTVLITGATDGIGLETARMLVAEGHHVLLHGRSKEKLDTAAEAVGADRGRYLADLSLLTEVDALADAVIADHARLDVLINNAGVFKVPQSTLSNGLDVRFVVNTLAPYRLTRRLLPAIPSDGRIINLSSAAQAPVSLDALRGDVHLSDLEAYSQSKLAITMWSRVLAEELSDGPVVVAVNPGSLLASKMVQQGFGVAGNDLAIGAKVLMRGALADEFADASGRYFDNDAGSFGSPHPDALDAAKSRAVVQVVESLLRRSVREKIDEVTRPALRKPPAARSLPQWPTTPFLPLHRPTMTGVPDYIGPANRLVAKHGGKYLARTATHEQIEGDQQDAALRIVIQWPSKEAAKAFMSDPEYVPHLEARTAGSTASTFSSRRRRPRLRAAAAGYTSVSARPEPGRPSLRIAPEDAAQDPGDVRLRVHQPGLCFDLRGGPPDRGSGGAAGTVRGGASACHDQARPARSACRTAWLLRRLAARRAVQTWRRSAMRGRPSTRSSISGCSPARPPALPSALPVSSCHCGIRRTSPRVLQPRMSVRVGG